VEREPVYQETLCRSGTGTGIHSGSGSGFGSGSGSGSNIKWNTIVEKVKKNNSIKNDMTNFCEIMLLLTLKGKINC
jgi:hypothetical protein